MMRTVRRNRHRRVSRVVQGVLLLLPPMLSMRGFCGFPMLWTAVSALAAFLFVALLPMCRSRESLWMFLLGAGTGLPAAFFSAVRLLQGIFSADPPVLFLLRGTFLFLLLLTVWGGFLAFLARLVWRKQRDGFPLPEDGGLEQ